MPKDCGFPSNHQIGQSRFACLFWVAGALALTHAASTLSAGADREMLVYYANETSPKQDEADNYRQFEQWLDSLHTEKADKAAKSLRRDETAFSAAVQTESDALLRAPVYVLIFQNSLAREARFLERPFPGRNSGAAISIPFTELPATDDPVYRANPLGSQAGLAAALREVRRMATREGITRIGIIFKSHGNAEMALTPRLATWHTEVRETEIAGLLEGGHDPNKPERGVRRGTFQEYLNTFQKELGREVEFVHLEACGTRVLPLRRGLSAGFHHVFAAVDEKVKLHTVDYPALIQVCCRTPGLDCFIERFAAELSRQGNVTELHLMPWPKRLAAEWRYFTPLALVLMCAKVRMFWQRKHKVPQVVSSPC
jgi:hypothetical protein